MSFIPKASFHRSHGARVHGYFLSLPLKGAPLRLVRKNWVGSAKVTPTSISMIPGGTQIELQSFNDLTGELAGISVDDPRTDT